MGLFAFSLFVYLRDESFGIDEVIVQKNLYEL